MGMMRLSAPAIDPVGFDEVKAHLNVFGDDDDPLIERLIMSATASLDGPYGDLGRCLISQRWRLTLDAFPRGPIFVPMPPTISVETLKYFDPAGLEITVNLDATGDSPPEENDKFWVHGLMSDGCAIINRLNSWPSTANRLAAVRIDFVAGYGATEADIPADLRNLLMARIATAYAVRESSVIGLQQGTNAETDAILDRYRTRGF